MNLPNKITLTRIFLIPICVFLLLINSVTTNIISVLIFVLACLTDALDGYIARKNNLVTDFGKFMDPLVDKLLIISVAIALVELKKISCWVVILIAWRELIVTGFRLIAAKKNTVIAANILGKIKTVLQMLMIIIIMLGFQNNFMHMLKNLLIVMTAFFTLWSGFDYIYINRQLLK